MCCICGCIASILDMIQRAITFMLACWLACVVCCGLIFAAAAGVAYGYNYSVAEFISLTSSDVTVYLRRGKFSDVPELKYKPRPPNRRSGGGDAFEGDDSSANLTAEFGDGGRQESLDERRSLSEAWVKAEDTRKYAEWLVKYGGGATSATEHSDTAAPAAPAAPNPYYVVTNVPPTRSPVPRSQASTVDSDFASTALFIRRYMSDSTPAQREHTSPDSADEPDQPIQDYEAERIPRIVTTAKN